MPELADEGHVYARKEQLIEKASSLLEAEDNCVIMTMDQMLRDKDLIPFFTSFCRSQLSAIIRMRLCPMPGISIRSWMSSSMTAKVSVPNRWTIF